MTTTNDTKQLVPVESTALIHSALSWCASITEIKINNDAEYVKACETTRALQAKLKEIDEDRRRNVDPLNALVREVQAQYRPAVDALENLKTNLRISTADYERARERERQEAKRLADERAQKERDDLAKKAEKENKKAEKAEAAGKSDDAEGHRTAAVALAQIAANVEATPPPPPAPKVNGLTYRDKWIAKVVDPKAVIRWCLAEDKLHFIKIDEAMLSKLAQSTKGQEKIPGVVFENRPTPVYR